MFDIIPAPAVAEAAAGAPFRLTDATAITAPGELANIADLFRRDIEAQTGLTLGGANPSIALVLRAFTEDELARFPTTQGRRADGGDQQGERYGLSIGDGRIEVWAPTAEGVHRGLTTLRQLIGTGTRAIPAGLILDGPRFAWRGLSLDTCRRFFPPDEVRQIIDLLALYKANVLHLHLTDTEGWRLQIDAWPKLTEIGGAGAAGDRPGGFYTKAEYADLVAYAAARFVTVVPEIDLPGHTGAVFTAYPELAGDGSAAVSADNPWLSHLHPDHPQVAGFVKDVLTELSALTPGGFIHLGGDETWGMPDDLYQRFMALVRPLVPAVGKQLVVWQEATRSGALDPADIVQYWLEFNPESLAGVADSIDLRDGVKLPTGQVIPLEAMGAILEMLPKSQGDVDRAMATGNEVLVSLSTCAYLDTPYAESSSDQAQEAERSRLGMPFYPKQTVAEFYDWDPATVHPRLPESAIAGVEAALWCVSVQTFEDAMLLMLPRFCGVAERAWSSSGLTWDTYRPGLVAQTELWERIGWPFFRSSLLD